MSAPHEQSQRLESLVQSLLDLSRIEAVESVTSFARVNFTQLVQEMGEQFASRAEQADRFFTMNITENSVNMLGNETQLRQILMNLLENALKFTPPGGSISVSLTPSQSSAQSIIRDTGFGIPAEDMPHVFERFHRGRNTLEYAGNGLGLSIVRAILKTHAGDITIRSQFGTVTEVRISLPSSMRQTEEA